MKIRLSTLAAAACALLLAIPLAAASASTATTKKTATNATTMRSAWPPETLSGKISLVDPASNLVVVQTAGGVPFDMVVTPKTRIESGGQSVTLKDLAQDTHDNVSVRFTPERRGDVASSINIGG